MPSVEYFRSVALAVGAVRGEVEPAEGPEKGESEVFSAAPCMAFGGGGPDRSFASHVAHMSHRTDHQQTALRSEIGPSEAVELHRRTNQLLARLLAAATSPPSTPRNLTSVFFDDLMGGLG